MASTVRSCTIAGAAPMSFSLHSVRRDGDVSLHNRIGDGGGVGEERQPLSKRFRNACRPPPLDVEAPDLGSVTISEPELEDHGT